MAAKDGERPVALHQRDGAELRLGHLLVALRCRRCDVDEDQLGHQRRLAGRDPQRRQAAQRHPDEQAGMRCQLAQHRPQRLGVEFGSVVAVLTPGRAAVPGQVDGQRGQPQPEDHGVPGVRVLSAPVQEHRLGRTFAPRDRADATQVDPVYRRQGTRHAGLFGVLGKQAELVEREQFVVGDHASLYDECAVRSQLGSENRDLTAHST